MSRPNASSVPAAADQCEECGGVPVATINGHGMCQEHIDAVMGRALSPVRAAIDNLRGAR